MTIVAGPFSEPEPECYVRSSVEKPGSMDAASATTESEISDTIDSLGSTTLQVSRVPSCYLNTLAQDQARGGEAYGWGDQHFIITYEYAPNRRVFELARSHAGQTLA